MSHLNLIDQTIDNFQIISELGRGGMGIVYKARQTTLDRIVALKILPQEMTYDQSYIERFHQEARSAARLEHPHIVTVLEVGEFTPEPSLPPLHYIAMKYIEGVTLKDLMQETGPFDVQQCSDIASQVAEALDHAHSKGILHRDVKPSNIMISSEGWVYLTDFGTARDVQATTDLTRAGTVIGTPEYMSPEQAQGLPIIGPATDTYALAVVIYEMLSGVYPFEAETPMGMLAARLTETPRPLRTHRPDLPPAIERVLMRALERAPQERFQHAGELIAVLKQACTNGAGKMHDDPAKTLVLPAGQTHSSAKGTYQHQNNGPDQKAASYARTSSARSEQGAARMSWTTLFRTPIGLITAILVLFLLVGGWYRITSILDNPTPTPVPPPTPVLHPSPTLIGAPPADEAQLVKQGMIYISDGKYDLAIQSFDEVLHHNPRSADALTGMGWALREQGTYKQSVDYLEKSLQVDNQQVDVYSLLGWNYYDLGDYNKAKDQFEQAITLEPDYANHSYGLGLTLDAMGRKEQAIEHLEKALELAEDSAEKDRIERDLSRISL